MERFPTRVVRHESELGSWELVDREAPPSLHGQVRGFTGFRERGTSFKRRRHVPTPEVALILNIGPRYRVYDADASEPVEHGSFLAALHDSVAFTEATGGVAECVEVRMTPLAAHALFGLPMHELASRVVGLEDLIGSEAHRLEDQVFEAAGWDARIDVVEAALAARIEQAPPSSPEIAWAWRALGSTSGRAPISSVADELGWSHKRLIARFREHLGLAPKTVARVMRFDRAIGLLQRMDEPRWVEIALDCGYYDQAHFNRDFQRLAGTTPTRLLASRLPDDSGLAGD